MLFPLDATGANKKVGYRYGSQWKTGPLTTPTGRRPTVDYFQLQAGCTDALWLTRRAGARVVAAPAVAGATLALAAQMTAAAAMARAKQRGRVRGFWFMTVLRLGWWLMRGKLWPRMSVPRRAKP
jgi:hypothetical protein